MSNALPDIFFVDRSRRGRLRLTGRDRQSFLQGMVTNDVAALQPGQGCYAFLLDATGHVLSDMRILCAEDHLLLDLEPGMATTVAETLDRYLIMEKCRITDVTAETAQVFIGGKDAPRVLARLGVEDAGDWAEGQNTSVDVGGDAALAAATRLIPGKGFDLYTEAVAVECIRKAVDAREMTEEALDIFRIEAGVPRFGVDIDSRVLAPETGQQRRAIHYRKGCYIGQEIVARIDARGHTNRTLTGFVLAEGVLPDPGAPVVAGDRPDAGRITSATFSPTLGRGIALGYIRHEYSEPGTDVNVAGRDARVTTLPFVAE